MTDDGFPLSDVLYHHPGLASEPGSEDLLTRTREMLGRTGGNFVLNQADFDSEDAYVRAIGFLARAAEIFDEGTGNHVRRVGEYSFFLARTVGLDEALCLELRHAAQLHDLGKMSVDPAVLGKKGPLDANERREMDNHTIYGHRILSQSPRLAMAAEIALNHHEKWDGTGYPNKLSGNAIPIVARITQIADIYDALRAERPYKGGFSHEQARKVLLLGDARIDAAGHFDPHLLEAFADTHAEFDRIWNELVDA